MAPRGRDAIIANFKHLEFDLKFDFLRCNGHVAGFNTYRFDEVADRKTIKEFACRDDGVIFVMKDRASIGLNSDTQYGEGRVACCLNETLQAGFVVHVFSLEDRGQDRSTTRRKLVASNFYIVTGVQVSHCQGSTRESPTERISYPPEKLEVQSTCCATPTIETPIAY